MFPPAPCKISWPYEVPFPRKLFFSLGVHTWTLWDPKGLSPLAPCKISWPYKVLFPHELIFSLGVHIWTPWDSKG